MQATEPAAMGVSKLSDPFSPFQCPPSYPQQPEAFPSRMPTRAAPLANPQASEANSLLVYSLPNNEFDPQSILVYHTSSLGWTNLPPQSQRLHCRAVTADEDKIFLVGGFSCAEKTASSSVHVLDLKSFSWFTIPTGMYKARSECSAVVCHLGLIALGGYAGCRECLATVELCDLTTFVWTQLPPMSRGRADCGAVFNRSTNELIVLGGFDGEDEYLASGEVFSFTTFTWHPFPVPMPNARYRFGIVCEKNVLFVVGGWNHEGPVECVEMFDSTTKTWTVVPSFPVRPSRPPFERCGAAMRDGKIYVCYRGHAYVLDVQSLHWAELPAPPEPMINPYCAMVKSHSD
jgi:hypothetical protein